MSLPQENPWPKIKASPENKLASEASTGFEPVIRVLQTLALPLGHDAILRNEDCRLTLLQSQSSIGRAGDGIRTHDLLLGKETFYHWTTPANYRPFRSGRECRDPGSNWGHRDFQSRALPTELSRPMYNFFIKRVGFYTYSNRLSSKTTLFCIL